MDTPWFRPAEFGVFWSERLSLLLSWMNPIDFCLQCAGKGRIQSHHRNVLPPGREAPPRAPVRISQEESPSRRRGPSGCWLDHEHGAEEAQHCRLPLRLCLLSSQDQVSREHIVWRRRRRRSGREDRLLRAGVFVGRPGRLEGCLEGRPVSASPVFVFIDSVFSCADGERPDDCRKNHQLWF